MAMIRPKIGALIIVCQRSVIGMTSRMRWTKVIGGMPSEIQQNRPPPMIAMIPA